MVSWVRCGTRMHRFLIFAFFFSFIKMKSRQRYQSEFVLFAIKQTKLPAGVHLQGINIIP